MLSTDSIVSDTTVVSAIKGQSRSLYTETLVNETELWVTTELVEMHTQTYSATLLTEHPERKLAGGEAMNKTEEFFCSPMLQKDPTEVDPID
jgi:hypothetical protein